MNRWIAASFVLGLLLAGCSSSPTEQAATDRSSPSPSATEGNGPLVPPLPSLTPTQAPSAKPSRSVAPDRVLGADVSWPQCPKGMGIPEKRSEGAPMPTPAAEFVILGLTNGPSFVANPCLADQVRWVADRHLLGAAYAVVSYPDQTTLRRYGARGPFPGRTRLGALSNVGYQAAVFNVATMRATGLRSPIVWVDVEPVPKFEWTADLRANAAVVRGAVRGYGDAGYPVGFYSTPSLWQRVVGDLRFGLPEWRAAGQTSLQEALSRCGPDWSFQGGPGVFGQWVEAGRDRNVTCPGTSVGSGRWFHRY